MATQVTTISTFKKTELISIQEFRTPILELPIPLALPALPTLPSLPALPTPPDLPPIPGVERAPFPELSLPIPLALPALPVIPSLPELPALPLGERLPLPIVNPITVIDITVEG